MVCEKVGSTVKAMQLHVHLRCVRLKVAQLRRSVFDIKVPRGHFESIRNCLYGTLMSYTDRSAHANKAKT